jgi:hypothetical protein
MLGELTRLTKFEVTMDEQDKNAEDMSDSEEEAAAGRARGRTERCEALLAELARTTDPERRAALKLEMQIVAAQQELAFSKWFGGEIH